MTAAVVLLLKEEEILKAFRKHGATSRAAAMSPSALAISEDMMFRSLRNRSLILEGAPGTFYVDEAAIDARRQARQGLRPVLAIIAIVLAVVAIGLVAWMRGGAAT